MDRELEDAGGVPTRERLQWIATVHSAVESGEISSSAFCLAYVIAFIYLNGKSGKAWPTQRTMAKRIRLGERQTRSLLADLEEARFITRKAMGRNRSDEIRLSFKRVKQSAITDTRAVYASWLGLR